MQRITSRCWMSGASLAILGLLWTTSAVAQQPSMLREMYWQMEAGRQRHVMWPYPYICPDRQRAREPFDVMVDNGWRRQNLLGPHHFNGEGTELSKAGELKVRWILTQAPPQHRSIYIERSAEPETTQLRVGAARQFASSAVLGSAVPLVQDTHIVTEGRSAALVDRVNISFSENMLPVVLPEGNTSTAASASP